MTKHCESQAERNDRGKIATSLLLLAMTEEGWSVDENLIVYGEAEADEDRAVDTVHGGGRELADPFL